MRSPTEIDAIRRLDRVLDTCDRTHAPGSAPAQAELSSLLLDLIAHEDDATAHGLAVRLARRLARAPWAPTHAVRALARCDIAIAAPLIAASDALTEDDLEALGVDSSRPHRVAVARRPHLPARVVQALIRAHDPWALAALAGNRSAALSELDLAWLVQASQRIPALRAPLARRSDLTPKLARDLAKPFDEDEAAALADEARAVEKLDRRGDLAPARLFDMARRGRRLGFQATLAHLAGTDAETVGRAMADDAARLSPLMARAGVDRAAQTRLLGALAAAPRPTSA